MTSNPTNQKLIASNGLFHPATALSPPNTLVIAEIGVNHDGSISRAIQLINAAANAGANAVKLQYFHPDRLLSNQAKLAKYQQGKASDPYELLNRLKLSLDELNQARLAARQCNLLFIVTPFSPDDIPELAQLDIDALKIASPDAVNAPLLKHAAQLNKPILISTGTADIHELSTAAQLLKHHQPAGCLMQCVSCYPTPPKHAAIAGVTALAEKFNLPVGYSDHTPELDTGALAVASSACAIEKHLTYDRNAHGPDHAASLTPDQFANYIKAIRRAEQILGPKFKSTLTIENDVKNISRQSICATRDLPANHILKPDDLTIKRPGTAIPAAKLYDIIGQTLDKPVKANDLLNASDLKP